ncbi:hypothetical protein BDQ17DRAFT_1328603 [Cyathus striatus]|nr:hypothetical protein BDQ17DRAFT_1428175 [Cyathus striatus]KAF8998806.1 hypothetical protein BDQ17DRAFT_1328603 [Cyathus striatus]
MWWSKPFDVGFPIYLDSAKDTAGGNGENNIMQESAPHTTVANGERLPSPIIHPHDIALDNPHDASESSEGAGEGQGDIQHIFFDNNNEVKHPVNVASQGVTSSANLLCHSNDINEVDNTSAELKHQHGGSNTGPVVSELNSATMETVTLFIVISADESRNMITKLKLCCTPILYFLEVQYIL